ncbi:DNA repair protein RAD51 homolog 3 isoform X2 [Tachysurus vachellii]|uniref:DNA repair protein RAD51 homolog 3 isoform X2 n=1 Tax=Tachysurus vachellii TaxID=175792 RepID=UPI00296B0CE6|nr:DNA repair protein RAD51 homolog 3 isoform X2 [Tachysurus vachellii]
MSSYVMMFRTVSSSPLAPSVKVKLITAGFHTAADVTDVQQLQLCKAGLSQVEAAEVLQTLRDDSLPLQQRAAVQSLTALDLLHQEETRGNIVTFCSELDAVLGGGIPVGRSTEICGVPGIGKTQLCVQLAVDVQIPVCFGGLGGEAVFVDTEGGFVVERLVGMARAAVEHCTALAEDQEQREALESFTVEKILSGVFLTRCHDHVALLAELHLLPDFLRKRPQVRLVVIDSVAFPFRHELEDVSQRTRLLSGFSQQLTRLASAQHGPAVVLTNQMTTKILSGQSRLVPALGEIWGHGATQRLIMHWEGAQRFVSLYKSSSQRDANVPYQLTAEGFRDTTVSVSSVPSHSPAAGSHSKRPRIEQQHT